MTDLDRRALEIVTRSSPDQRTEQIKTKARRELTSLLRPSEPVPVFAETDLGRAWLESHPDPELVVIASTPPDDLTPEASARLMAELRRWRSAG